MTTTTARPAHEFRTMGAAYNVCIDCGHGRGHTLHAAPTAEQRKRAILATTKTRSLMIAARDLDARGATLSHEERMALVWVREELEARYPAAAGLLDAWVEDEADTRTYNEVLFSAVFPPVALP